jgi:hypothetical protein
MLVAILFLVTLALTGGASLYNENQQPLVRLAAIAALIATFWPLEFEPLAAQKRLLCFLGATYALVLLQLVPLPPTFWASLPGRDVYASIARESGTVAWRPLSLTPDLTLNSLLALLPATAAVLSALYLNRRGRGRLFLALLIIAAASALLGLMQAGTGGSAFHLYRHSTDYAPVGLFANRNHQAVLLAAALPLAGAIGGIKARGASDGRKVAAVTLGLAMLLLLGLVSTGSRMGVVLGGIGTIAALGCYFTASPIDSHSGRFGKLAVGGLAVGLLGLIGLAAERSGAIERLLLTDTVTESRAAMIAPLLATARAFMPVGSGFGSFDSVYRRFEPDALLSTIYMNQAHNEAFQLAIEGGVLALALLALFLVWWLRTAVAIFRQRISIGVRTMGMAATAMTAIFMASSLVDYPLRTPLLAAAFAIACIEMMRSAAARPVEEDERKRRLAESAPLAAAHRRWQPQ